jgi:glyoxylase-like metal-dependent hydrolase (beta-lactamase superfamily II)
MLEIVSFVLGPVQTNTYLLADLNTGEAVIVDPAWDDLVILENAEERDWRITAIWLTHAHFDHVAGALAILEKIDPCPWMALHPDDRPLWQVQGGAPFFGMKIELGPEPSASLEHGQILKVGSLEFEVRHTPGHTPGHVVFYCAEERVVFCGDVIFYGGIGRTDLPGGSYQTLMQSIHTQILTLPDDTRLLSGHGPETFVGRERRDNPFLQNKYQI